MIYLDNAATTKPSKIAIEKANIYNEQSFFNPSALYSGGLSVARELKCVKARVLKCLGSVNHEVIFTSCGTESDNTAIFCAIKRGAFLTTKGEHSAVYNSFMELSQRGNKVYFCDLNIDGSVNEEKLLNIVKENKIDFVSVVHVNNETGAINDVNKIGKALKTINPKIVFHVDGVQAFGKLPYRLSNDIDLYSISAHKINALKGTGVLIKKKGLHLSPYIIGGGQEGGLRSGTENVFGIKVFDFAMQDKYAKIKENHQKLTEIKQKAVDLLDKTLFKVISTENSSPYILLVSALGVRGEIVMHALEKEDIIVGNGSACSSKSRHSRVLKECGYNEQVLDGAVRISFSTETTLEEVEIAIKKLNESVKKLKGIMD